MNLKDNSPKVLQVISSLGMGGAETWLVQILRYWRKNRYGYEMDFLITSGKQGIFDEEVIRLGAKVFYVELSKNNLVDFIREFRNILKENNYKAIHDHQDFLSGWHFLFGIGLLPPIRVSHIHNPAYQLIENYGINIRRKAIIKIGKILIRYLSTHIKGTSGQILYEYGITNNNYPNQEISPLYCSFLVTDWMKDKQKAKEEIYKEFNLSNNTKVILFAGRLDYSLDRANSKNHKNSAFALDIMEALNSPNIIMLMAGANSFIKDEFEKEINTKGLATRVKLIGLRKDLPTLMSGSDILLFPSRAEGLGMVAVEAQAACLPVLASSSIPKECVVISELVTFMNLASPPIEWANQINEILAIPVHKSDNIDSRWLSSEFNIEKSSHLLLSLYFGFHEN